MSARTTRPPPSPAAPRKTGPSIPTFHLSDENSTTPIPPSDPRHDAVGICIRVALSLLRSPNSMIGFTAEDTIRGARRDPSARRSQELDDWMFAWMEMLEGDFGTVKLTGLTDVEADAKCAGRGVRETWFEWVDWTTGTRGGKRGWTPKVGGTMFVCREMIEHMVSAKKGRTSHHRNTYNTFSFTIGLAIARGLVFSFMSSIAPNLWEAPTTGGRELDVAWESRAFYGKVYNLRDPEDPLGKKQAGTVWVSLGRRGMDNRLKRVVVPEDLAGIKLGALALPLKTVGGEQDRDTLLGTNGLLRDPRRRRTKAAATGAAAAGPADRTLPLRPAGTKTATATKTTATAAPKKATNTNAAARSMQGAQGKPAAKKTTTRRTAEGEPSR